MSMAAAVMKSLYQFSPSPARSVGEGEPKRSGHEIVGVEGRGRLVGLKTVILLHQSQHVVPVGRHIQAEMLVFVGLRIEHGERHSENRARLLLALVFRHRAADD